MDNWQQMPLETDPRNMPLADALLNITRQNRSSWHTPAHGGGRDFPVSLREHLIEMDVTELPMTGDINNPTGPVREALDMAAIAYGAGITRFVTSGSTTALQIMLALGVGRGESLLLPRCVHQAIVHAIALLDIQPCWIDVGLPPETDSGQFSLLPQVTPAQVEKAMHLHPECRAVILTSPDYYGFCPDLAAIARIVHDHGKLLLVDEAHGAHLSFMPGLPASAMRNGADACVQSGHKTLPVLTPGAMIHISSDAISTGRLDAERLASLVPVFQTSSPSFSVAATLDYARAWLANYGTRAIEEQSARIECLRNELPAAMTCAGGDSHHESAGRRDPIRLVLAGPTIDQPLPSRRYADCLADEGIDIEFADLTRMVLIPSLLQPRSEWQRLSAALIRSASKIGASAKSTAVANLDAEWRYWLTARPDKILAPGDVLFGNLSTRRISLTESAGRICARPILPYPPGVPLIWPGERIDDLRVDFLRRLSENSISINGIEQDSILVLS